MRRQRDGLYQLVSSFELLTNPYAQLGVKSIHLTVLTFCPKTVPSKRQEYSSELGSMGIITAFRSIGVLLEIWTVRSKEKRSTP